MAPSCVLLAPHSIVPIIEIVVVVFGYTVLIPQNGCFAQTKMNAGQPGHSKCHGGIVDMPGPQAGVSDMSCVSQSALCRVDKFSLCTGARNSTKNEGTAR